MFARRKYFSQKIKKLNARKEIKILGFLRVKCLPWCVRCAFSWQHNYKPQNSSLRHDAQAVFNYVQSTFYFEVIKKILFKEENIIFGTRLSNWGNIILKKIKFGFLWFLKSCEYFYIEVDRISIFSRLSNWRIFKNIKNYLEMFKINMNIFESFKSFFQLFF